MDAEPPIRLSRGEPVSRAPRTGRWIAAAIVAIPVLYFGAYLAVRASHLIVHRISISGPLHQVGPGEDCPARRALCGGVMPCAASTSAIPRLFAPLISVEAFVREVGRYM